MMKAAVIASAHLAEGPVAGGYRTSGHGGRFARVAVLNAAATASLLLAASQGLADWTPAIATLAYGWAGLLVFFALVRSGWSNGRADPTLSFELLMFAISVVVMSYGLLDIARGAALELLCLLLAFGMDRLSARQLCKASFFAAGMLALTSLARITLGEGAVRVHAEVFNLLMATVLLPVSVVVGGEIGRLHRRQAAQRGELASALQRLTEISLHDGLTGLPNRPHMLRLIEAARLQSTTTGQAYCLALLDIDWFKRVNDGYGHAVGDLVLKDFAALMTSTLEHRCAFGLWGGEEFLLLMPACAPLQAQAVLSACRQKMAAHVWGAGTNGLHVTFLQASREAGLAKPSTTCCSGPIAPSTSRRRRAATGARSTPRRSAARRHDRRRFSRCRTRRVRRTAGRRPRLQAVLHRARRRRSTCRSASAGAARTAAPVATWEPVHGVPGCGSQTRCWATRQIFETT